MVVLISEEGVPKVPDPCGKEPELWEMLWNNAGRRGRSCGKIIRPPSGRFFTNGHSTLFLADASNVSYDLSAVMSCFAVSLFCAVRFIGFPLRGSSAQR